MDRIIMLIMSLAFVLAVSIPVACAAEDASKCLQNCEAHVEMCKKSCQGDQACEKECAAQEDQCKAGCK